MERKAMRIRLHEIELSSRDTEASQALYAGNLGFGLGRAFEAGT